MSTAVGESLLDEADFLAELERVEQGMPVTRRAVAPPADRSLQAPMPTRMEERRHLEPERHHREPVIVGGVAAFGFFVLMVAAGAAGAALVFHERIVALLSRIQ